MYKIDKVKLSKMKPSPAVKRSFNPAIMASIRQTKKIVDEVYPQTMDEWLDGYYRDLNPKREMFIWAHIAGVYKKFAKQFNADLETKKAIFTVAFSAVSCYEIKEILKMAKNKLSEKQVTEIYHYATAGMHLE